MKIAKKTVDRGLTIVAAVAAPVLSLLIRHHVITAADSVDIGAILAGVVAAYHGGAAVQRRAATGALEPPRTTTGKL